MSPLEPQMVTIPAGIVTLGASRCPNNFPLHRWRGPKQVEVKEYQIARHTVTRGDYERFVNDTDHPLPLDWDDRVLADPRLPVCGVSAEDADAYCAWLSDKPGRAYLGSRMRMSGRKRRVAAWTACVTPGATTIPAAAAGGISLTTGLLCRLDRLSPMDLDSTIWSATSGNGWRTSISMLLMIHPPILPQANRLKLTAFLSEVRS